MSPATFRGWRKRRGLSQIEAAAALGLGTRIIGYYESGEKPIPLYIELACAALALGISRFPE